MALGPFRRFRGDYGQRRRLAPVAPENPVGFVAPVPPDEPGSEPPIPPSVITTLMAIGTHVSVNQARVMGSTDGISWAAGSQIGVVPVSAFAVCSTTCSVGFVDTTVFIACDSSLLWRSIDGGQTWLNFGSVNMTANWGWKDVAGGDGRFIAVTTGGEIWQSVDSGITWTNPTNITDAFTYGGVLCADFVNHKFFVGYLSDTEGSPGEGQQGTIGFALVGSDNGGLGAELAWVVSNPMFSGAAFNFGQPLGFAYNADFALWGAAGSVGLVSDESPPGTPAAFTRPAVSLSADALGWGTPVTFNAFMYQLQPNTHRLGFASAPGTFVISISDGVGGNAQICSSLNGVSWDTVTIFPNDGANSRSEIRKIIWVDSLNLFVALHDVSNNPFSSTTGKVWTSPDGSTWTERTDTPWIIQNYNLVAQDITANAL